ncbi:MAG: hypothetical protein C4583_03325 [Anaerolineaceae bacterium]|nr:MAG: hypothetical protein C4583_03325 [Anaerolineaceae bacterium]
MLPNGIERHHVVPRSLGGLRFGPANHLAPLTYREHFLAHWLLTKFTTGSARKKMANALWAMTRKGAVSAWRYAIARAAHRESLLGSSWNRGRKHAQEVREKMRMAHLGKKFSEEHKRKIGLANAGNRGSLGMKRSDETRKKMSKPKSEEHRSNISAALVGNKRALGHRHSEETRRKISVNRSAASKRLLT